MFVGHDTNWASLLTAKAMSNLVPSARYRTSPIQDLYNSVYVLLSASPSLFSSNIGLWGSGVRRGLECCRFRRVDTFLMRAGCVSCI